MNKKEIRYAFKTVLNIARNMECEDLHHPKKHQHDNDPICPVEYKIQRQVHVIEQFIKDLIK